MKAVLIAGVAGLVSAVCAGADITWKGEGETTAWSDGSNWEGGVAPGSGDTAVIPSGKTAGMASGDITYVSGLLTKISIPTADAVLFITNNTQVSLSVPLSGVGQVVVSNALKQLTFAADNGNFSGPMTFIKSQLATDYSHANAFGKDNVITNLTKGAQTQVYFFKSGNYYNTWYIFGGANPDPKRAFYPYYAVVFKNPVHVQDAFNFATQQNGTITYAGGVYHTGVPHVSFMGPNTVAEGTVCDFDRSKGITSGDFFSGGYINSNTFTLNTPVLTRPYYLESNYATYVYSRIGIGGEAVLLCGKPFVLTGGLCIQYGYGPNASGGKIDLNGFDQACGSMYKYGGDTKLSKTISYVTSAKPATLTMRGQWELYGNQPGGANTQVTPLAINDKASFVFWPTNAIRNSTNLKIWPVINFKDTEWSTSGMMACRRGTMTLNSDVTIPNIKKIEVTHEGELVVKTSSINPDKFVLAVTNNTPRSGKYPLTLAAGVVLKANKAVFGAGTEYGDWLEPGTYGGLGALTNDLIDAAHKIDSIGGDGILTVKSPGHPGLLLLVK